MIGIRGIEFDNSRGVNRCWALIPIGGRTRKVTTGSVRKIEIIWSCVSWLNDLDCKATIFDPLSNPDRDAADPESTFNF